MSKKLAMINYIYYYVYECVDIMSKMKRVNISIRMDQWHKIKSKEDLNFSGKVREMIDREILVEE